MVRISRIVFHLSLLLGSPLAGLASERQTDRGASVTIFVYNDAKVPPAVMGAAEKEAARVLERAGMASEWRERPGGKDSECDPLAENQAVMRIVSEGTHAAETVFGIAYLSPQGYGRYSEVFYNRIKRIEADSRASMPRLLGHVMAHELGHLLLGSNAHAVSGIMRAQWQPQEMRQVAMGTLLFSPEQAARMQARVAQRGRISAASRRERGP